MVRAASTASSTRPETWSTPVATEPAKPVGPTDQHPDPHAPFGVVVGPLEVAIAYPDLLGADALHPQLGVGAAELLGPAQGRVPERIETIGCEGAGGGSHAGHDRRPTVGDAALRRDRPPAPAGARR